MIFFLFAPCNFKIFISLAFHYLAVDGVTINQIEKFKHLEWSILSEDFRTYLTLNIAPHKRWETEGEIRFATLY